MGTGVTVVLLLASLLALSVLAYKSPSLVESYYEGRTKYRETKNRQMLLSHQTTIRDQTEVEYLRLQIELSQQEIQRLTNLWITKDPVTFGTIQAQTNSQSYSPDSTPNPGFSTDIGEYNQWAAANGQPLAQEPNDVFITDRIG